ncbi:MAG: GNAT family N-acetyltransferase [Candidatus Velthaea sp.]
MQSPLDFAATFTPMNSKAVHAIVDAIVADGIVLPGAIGEALTALAFATCWTERMRCGAVPVRGLRLYELHDLRDRVAVRGSLRRPMPGEQDLLVGWMTAFYAEVDERGNPQRNVDDGMASDGLWLWDDGGPVSMAALSAAAAGVRRVQGVYTPEQYRNRGYAGACVSGLAIKTHRNGQRCVLFADLGNAASNSLYRGLGFTAVSDNLRYRFDYSSKTVTCDHETISCKASARVQQTLLNVDLQAQFDTALGLDA